MTARYPLVLNGSSIQELQPGDTINGADSFAPGTQLLFIQAAAPSGWTKSTSYDNYALRIVSGTGGGTGGSVAFSTAFANRSLSGTTDATTLSVSQIPSHAHQVGGGSCTVWSDLFGTQAGSGGPWSSYTGGGGSHTHTASGLTVNMAVKYVDSILCVKS